MDDEALFTLEPEPRPGVDVSAELHRTGGVPTVVDHGFATAERTWLDETSWVDHVRGWLSGDRALMALLIEEASWEQRSRWMYTRTVTEPRLTAEQPVVADAPQPVLRYLAGSLSAHYGREFSRLWMNWYRDERDATGWHADRPADQQPEATVPVLSLGATRRFLVRPRGGGRSTSFVVRGGDLVVMGGRTQRDHQHCVPKEKTAAGPRLSLNFSIALPPGRRQAVPTP